MEKNYIPEMRNVHISVFRVRPIIVYIVDVLPHEFISPNGVQWYRRALIRRFIYTHI